MNSELSPQYLQRFSGIARLYGVNALPALARAHFVIVGLGGVGSWVAEALARSGVGQLTLIDLDDVCITNSNRQLPALSSTVGQSKIAVIAQRLRDINPEMIVHEIEDFINTTNIRDYIQADKHHIVVDAIDSPVLKAAMIAYCLAIKVRLVTVGSAGGKTDPCQIRASDLGSTISDPMLAKVRNLLYKRYRFQKSEGHRRFRVDAVYSLQQAVFPHPDGAVCQQKSAEMDGVRLDCTSGFGSSTMLAGAMGFAAAEQAIQRYLKKQSAN